MLRGITFPGKQFPLLILHMSYLSYSACTRAMQVLLHAGPVGLKVSKVVEAAKAMGLVASDWVSNKNSRSSQISNAIRNTDMFTHVGDHRYAIAAFPGVQHVPLKPQQGTSQVPPSHLFLNVAVFAA